MLEKLVSFDTTSRNSNLQLIEFVSDYLSKHAIKSYIFQDGTKKKANLVVSLCETKPIEWNRYIRSNGTFYKIVKNQKNKKNYLLNGSIFIFSKSFLKKKANYNEKSFAYVMPRKRSVDIDDIEDFLYAKYLISRNYK